MRDREIADLLERAPTALAQASAFGTHTEARREKHHEKLGEVEWLVGQALELASGRKAA